MSLFTDAMQKGLDAQFDLDGIQASFQNPGGLQIPDILVLKKDRSGLLDDGTVRSNSFEFKIKRSDIDNPKNGGVITIQLVTYEIAQIIFRGNFASTVACNLTSTP